MMPQSFVTQDANTKKFGFLEATNEKQYYLVAIRDLRLAGDKAPFEFVAGRIANLILNTRKMALIDQLEKNIYKKGQDENLFKIKEVKLK